MKFAFTWEVSPTHIQSVEKFIQTAQELTTYLKDVSEQQQALPSSLIIEDMEYVLRRVLPIKLAFESGLIYWHSLEQPQQRLKRMFDFHFNCTIHVMKGGKHYIFNGYHFFGPCERFPCEYLPTCAPTHSYLGVPVDDAAAHL